MSFDCGYAALCPKCLERAPEFLGRVGGEQRLECKLFGAHSNNTRTAVLSLQGDAIEGSNHFNPLAEKELKFVHGKSNL